MANPSPLNLRVAPATFVAQRGRLFDLKVNRLARWSAEDTPARAVGEWGNLVDDFMIAAQTTLQLFARGSGSPQGAVAAVPGTIYLNTETSPTGTRLWVKATGTGATGWTQVGGTIEPDSLDPDVLTDSAGLSVLGRGAASSGARADIVAGTDGHVLRRAGGVLAFGLIGIDSVGDATRYEVDFTQITPFTFTTNGNVTIDGRTWVLGNIAAATLLELSATDGLHFTRTGNVGGTGYNSSGQTATNLQATFASLLGTAFHPERKYRVDMRFGTTSLPTSADYTQLMHMPVGAGQNIHAVRRGNFGAGASTRIDGSGSSSSLGSLSSSTVYEVHTLVVDRTSVKSYAGNLQSGAWPELRQMAEGLTTMRSFNESAAANIANLDATARIGIPFAHGATAAANMNVRIRALRIVELT